MTPVLDFHTHPFLPEHLNPHMVEFIRAVSPAVRRHGERLGDPGFAADRLREQGVRRAVVLAEHCPETSGNVRTETVLDWCAAEPGFFLPFASVHPRLDPDPAALLRGYIEAGARGLKLYPSYQFFYPNDPIAYPLYEVCQAHAIPLLLHIGSSVVRGTRLKFCDPIHLDDVAVDFPELTIVMAHGGRGFWYDACAFLARHFDNVYIDVTGLPPGRLPRHYPRLDQLAHKMVFGSDWPAMPKSVEHNVEVIRALGLPDDALDALLRRNARRLLRLDDETDTA